MTGPLLSVPVRNGRSTLDARAVVGATYLPPADLLEEVRARAAAVVPRTGRPDADPLLRAEMDRRDLLRVVDDLLAARDAWENLVQDHAQAMHRGRAQRAEARLDAVLAVVDECDDLTVRRSMTLSALQDRIRAAATAPPPGAAPTP